jgi:hypothetical protein
MMIDNKYCKVISFVALLVLISFGCTNSNLNNFSSKAYTKIEIYCWCFFQDPKEDARDGHSFPANGTCETPLTVTPSRFVNTQNFYDSISNGVQIRSIQHIIFDSKSMYEKAEDSHPESRFLILLKGANSESDTIVYSYPNQFCLNSKYILKYSFNVVDSIRKILKKDSIGCPSQPR